MFTPVTNPADLCTTGPWCVHSSSVTKSDTRSHRSAGANIWDNEHFTDWLSHSSHIIGSHFRRPILFKYLTKHKKGKLCVYMRLLLSINPLHFQFQKRPSLHPKQVFAAKLTEACQSGLGSLYFTEQRDQFSSFWFTEWLRCQRVRNMWYLGCAWNSQELDAWLGAWMWIRAYPIFYPSPWTVLKSRFYESFITETRDLKMDRGSLREAGVFFSSMESKS